MADGRAPEGTDTHRQRNWDRTSRDGTSTVWEAERWWVGVGFRAENPRFVADGEQVSAWKGAKDAINPSAALSRFIQNPGSALQNMRASDDRAATAAVTISIALLEAANASLSPSSDHHDHTAAGAGTCSWVWAQAGWSVVRDGSTDTAGWTYATDWPEFASAREGGRKSKRITDMVRRRRFTRARILVDNAANQQESDLGNEEASLLGAIAELEVVRRAEVELEKQHYRQVLGVVKDLTKTHVLSRPFTEQFDSMDPTAWYRLSNTHHGEFSTLLGSRPALTDADLPILSDLVRAARFAWGAYGFAADKLDSISSAVQMQFSTIDYKDGVDADIHKEALCRYARIDPDAVLFARWDAKAHAPACFVAVSEAPLGGGATPQAKGWVVVGVRGTLNFNDTLCDLDAREVDFLGGKAHHGFAAAAAATIASTQSALTSAVEKYVGYEVVVCGHSLGGCTAQLVALKLRQIGRDEGIEAFEHARCIAFAGGPAASPQLQQTEESKRLTVCVVFGDDIVPRLSTKSLCTLLDELSAHGALSTARRTFHSLVGKLSSADAAAATNNKSEQEPEPELQPTDQITRLALGGRVLWIDPDFKLSLLQDGASTSGHLHMRWIEWGDLAKICVSSKMVEHHVLKHYLCALESRIEASTQVHSKPMGTYDCI